MVHITTLDSLPCLSPFNAELLQALFRGCNRTGRFLGCRDTDHRSCTTSDLHDRHEHQRNNTSGHPPSMLTPLEANELEAMDQDGTIQGEPEMGQIEDCQQAMEAIEGEPQPEAAQDLRDSYTSPAQEFSLLFEANQAAARRGVQVLEPLRGRPTFPAPRADAEPGWGVLEAGFSLEASPPGVCLDGAAFTVEAGPVPMRGPGASPPTAPVSPGPGAAPPHAPLGSGSPPASVPTGVRREPRLWQQQALEQAQEILKQRRQRQESTGAYGQRQGVQYSEAPAARSVFEPTHGKVQRQGITGALEVPALHLPEHERADPGPAHEAAQGLLRDLRGRDDPLRNGVRRRAPTVSSWVPRRRRVAPARATPTRRRRRREEMTPSSSPRRTAPHSATPLQRGPTVGGEAAPWQRTADEKHETEGRGEGRPPAEHRVPGVPYVCTRVINI